MEKNPLARILRLKNAYLSTVEVSFRSAPLCIFYSQPVKLSQRFSPYLFKALTKLLVYFLIIFRLLDSESTS